MESDEYNWGVIYRAVVVVAIVVVVVVVAVVVVVVVVVSAVVVYCNWRAAAILILYSSHRN